MSYGGFPIYVFVLVIPGSGGPLSYSSRISIVPPEDITSTVGTGTQEWHECPICVIRISGTG